MKLYLSSYKIGNRGAELKAMTPNGVIGYIPNARDFSQTDLDRKKMRTDNDVESLQALGLEVEELDLRHYFGNATGLQEKLEALGAVFISGGNVFILRQAMKLSGFDQIIHELKVREDFLYAGYSAGPCVLSPTLKGYEIVDDATDTPYPEQTEVLWDGLGITDFQFMPHFDSDHPESEDVGKAIQFYQANNIPYQALHDGKVLVM